MKKVIFIVVVFSFSFPVFSTGLEPIALTVMPLIGQYICLPACRWCTGSIHDALETAEEKENRAWLNGLTASNPDDFKITLENCGINIFENGDEKSSLLSRLLSGEDPSFKGELSRLSQANLLLRELQFGPTIHALIFQDENHILPIGGWIQKPSHQDFDFLFENKKLSLEEEDEKIALEKIVSKLNKILSKSDQPDQGLFLSPSGRKFYKFGPTYILPLSTAEMDTQVNRDIHSIHQSLGFQDAGRILENTDLEQVSFSKIEIDFLQNNVDKRAKGHESPNFIPTNSASNSFSTSVSNWAFSKNTFKKRSLAFLKNCFGFIHNYLETDLEKLSRVRLNSVIKSPVLQESMIEFKMKNCNIHLFEQTPDLGHLFPSHSLSENQKELEMIWSHKMRLVDLELGPWMHMLVFHDDFSRLPIHGVIKRPNAQNFDHLFQGDESFRKQKYSKKYSPKHAFYKVVGVLNRILENSTDPYEGLYVSPAGRLFYKFGSTYFLPLTRDEMAQQLLTQPQTPAG